MSHCSYISEVQARKFTNISNTHSITITSIMFLKMLEMVSKKLIPLGLTVWPIILTGLLGYSRSFISMIFLGCLGDVALSGGSFSIAFANITGYSVLKGLAMGMEPICYQAYGAQRCSVLSQTFRKTLFLLLVVTFPISILWLYSKPILLWLGQDEETTLEASTFIQYSIPDLVLQASFNPLRTFLRTQNINMPLTLSVTVSTILHFPINYFLAVYLDMGVKGVALASGWNTLNMNVGLLIYLYQSETSLKPWEGATTNIFSKGWGPLIALSFQSVLSVCLEWWCYEILLLLSGSLSNPKACVAAMGILIQTTGLLYVFPSSLCSSLSILVGNELGADEPEQARQTTITGIALAVLWGFVAILFTTAVRDVWGTLFTSEPEILGLTSIILPIIGFCELWNSVQTAACGILVGSARPKMGCLMNFVSFYLIGLRVAILLVFKSQMGFTGLWLGLATAQILCACMMICTLCRTDWRQQASRAKELTLKIEGSQSDMEANLLT